ncbi:hypothetical protein MNBD_BACTEROID05-724, partial [hydrothermal vent metagenome]
MPNKLLPAFILSILLMTSSSVHAMLLGDTIGLSHRFPSSDDFIEGYLVEVQAGNSDVTTFGSIYTANPEDDQILYDFFRPFTFSSDPFNGNVVEFIDDSLVDVTVDTNLLGWDDSFMSMEDDRIAFNWRNLSVDQNSYFYASLAFASPDEWESSNS